MTALILTQKRIKNVVIGVLAAWVAQIGVASAATTVPGLMAGQFEVDNNGAATYTIPIEVPPGKGGIEPHLALKYNSQKGNGLLGVGWTLEGLGAIQRCGGNIGTDGAKSGIDKTAERFCWNGQRLINISTVADHPLRDSFNTGCNGVAALAEYRTQIDTYARVLSCGGTDVTNPNYFVVYTKDGQTLKFGTRTDSNVKVNGGTETLVWALDRQENRINDYLEIYYSSTSGSYYPNYIIYTGNGTINTPKRAVKFTYEARTTDPLNTAVAGQLVTLSWRLSSIDTYSAIDKATLSIYPIKVPKVNTYKLEYAASPSTGDAAKGADPRSRISQVTRCDSTGLICLPATRFIASSDAASTSPVFSAARTSDVTIAKSDKTFFVDMDGDGYKDVVTAADNYVTINFGGAPGEAPRASSTQYLMNMSNSTFAKWTEVLDMNGDGLGDIAYWSGFRLTDAGLTLTAKSKQELTVAYGVRTRVGNRDTFSWESTVKYPNVITWGLNSTVTPGGAFTYPAYAPVSLRRLNQFVDVDGDGIMEILRAVVPATINDATKNSFPSSFESVRMEFRQGGDGSKSTVLKTFNYAGYCAGTKTGADGTFGNQCVLADFNGDGLPDLGMAWTTNTDYSTFDFRVFLGNGKGGFGEIENTNGTVSTGNYVSAGEVLARLSNTASEVYSFTASNQFADLNGDGILDILASALDSTTTYKLGDYLGARTRYYGGSWKNLIPKEINCASTPTNEGCGSFILGVVDLYKGYVPAQTLTSTLQRSLGAGSASKLYLAPATQNILATPVPLAPTAVSCPSDYEMADATNQPKVPYTTATVSNPSTYTDYCYTAPNQKCADLYSHPYTLTSGRTVVTTSYAISCNATYAIDASFKGVSTNNRYADMNGDGYPDLIALDKKNTADTIPTVYIAYGYGDGLFRSRVEALSLAAAGADVTLVQAFESVVDLQDMDGDGLTDIVVHTSTGLRVYYAQYASPTRIISIDTNNSVTYNIEYARHFAIGTLPIAKASQNVLANAGMYIVKNYTTNLGGVESNVDMRYGAWVADWKYNAGSLAWVAKTQTSIAPSRATQRVFSTDWPHFGQGTESSIQKVPGAGCLLSGLTGDCTILTKTVSNPNYTANSTTSGVSTVYQVHVSGRTTFDDYGQQTTESYQGFDIFGDPTNVTTLAQADWSGSTESRVYTRQSTLTGFLGDLQRLEVATTLRLGSGSSATRTTTKEFNNFVDADLLGRGLLSSEVVTSIYSALSLKRTYAYYPVTGSTQAGMLKTVEESGENGAYDANGAVTTFSDKRTMSYSYANLFSGDPQVTKKAGVLSETVVTDAKTGQRNILKDDANNVSTSWTYDDFGRLADVAQVKAEVRPDGSGTSVVYSMAGGDPDTYSSALQAKQMAGVAYIAIATPKDNASGSLFPVKTVYDGFGRKLRTVTRATDGDRVYTDYTYDVWGRLTSETKPYFVGTIGLVSTSYEYDLLDRNTVVTRSSAGKTTTDYGGYDATESARLITTTEQRGDTDLATKRYVDVHGRTVKIFDSSGFPTEYRYTPFGELQTVKRNTTLIVFHGYDGLGFLETTIDSDLGTWDFGYNAWGELKWQKDAKKQITNMTYDQLGRLKTRDVQGWGLSTWYYDAVANSADETWKGQGTAIAGRLIEVTGPNGFREQHFYDPIGRETAVATTTDKLRYVTGISYDSYGRTRDLSYPSGGPVIRHDYFPNGALKSIGELGSSGATTPVWTATARDASGRVTGESFGSNTLTGSRSYNAQFGLTESIQTGSLQNLSYNYDKLGNMTWRQDLRQGVREDFSYDSVNRLDTVKRNGSQSADFDFDMGGHGNLVKNGLGTLNYGGSRLHVVNSIGTANARVPLRTVGDTNQDQLIDASDVTSAALYAAGQTSAIKNITWSDCSYSDFTVDILDAVCIAKLAAANATPTLGYDNNGNMTSGLGRSIRYTPFNQPSGIDGVAASTSYQYDAYFNRIGKQSNSAGVVTTTTYIGDLYEKTQTASGTEHRYYIYAGGRLVSLRKHDSNDATNLYYILTDHLGSLDVITNQDGAELVRLSFDAYGQRRNTNWTAGTGILGTPITTRGFTGAEMEDEVGLVHLGARMYDAKLGRFLTPDSIIPDVGNGQSLNRYSYVLNNPLSWVDPTGHANASPSEMGYGNAGGQVYFDSNGNKLYLPAGNGSFTDITAMTGGNPGGSMQGYGDGMRSESGSTWEAFSGVLKAVVPGYGYSVSGMNDIFRGDYVSAAANFGAMGAEVGMAAYTLGASQLELAMARSTASVASSAFSPIVSGGGLAAHEAAGGHLLLKHVGQTETQLLDRLAVEPRISGSSSFYNRATAENAVSGVLDARQADVSSWLSGSSNRLRLDYSLPEPVGISVSRGVASAAEVNSARVILVRDPLMPLGYRIQTGFPTKP